MLYIIHWQKFYFTIIYDEILKVTDSVRGRQEMKGIDRVCQLKLTETGFFARNAP